MIGVALASAMVDRIANDAAVALSPTLGWLMLAAAVTLASIFVLHRDTWRRLWLRAEDPRTLGLFRVVFGLMTMANINGLWELFGYLFTDEGLFLTDAAQELFASAQFAGFGEGVGGEPYGFFDGRAWLEFLKGPKFSALLFWSSPTVFWIHLAAFELACLALIVGFQTRWTKWLTLLLFHSLILRNQVFWEGTENVYRCFLFYLCLSRCDAAYSVDNWLRCRRLRAAGRLSEPGGPGGGAGALGSLEAIYRLVPAWPRYLIVLQVAAIYCTTGAMKNGAVWAAGDAFYYALNLDHFYRFEPQRISAILGTNLFRVATHVVHWWEALFPLVVVGLVIRFVRRDAGPRLSGAQAIAARLLWALLGLLALAIVRVALPVHWPEKTPAGSWSLDEAQRWLTWIWLGAMAIVAFGWRWLAHPRIYPWLLGRRTWLGLGLVFHAHLMVLMNIGWFTPATMAGYIAFFEGDEVARVLTRLRSFISRRGGRRPKGAIEETITPAEDPSLPHLHRDAAALPAWALVAAIGALAFGVVLAAPGALLSRPIPWVRTGIGVFVGLAVIAYVQARRRGRVRLSVIDPANGRPRVPWAYGPLGRLLAGSLVIYHAVGVAIWLLPEKDCLSTWRTRAQEPFKWWLRTTQTSQGWKMFAPNPPRRNLSMRVLVIDHAGETFDLNTDIYHPENRPIPWIWYTRQRKINRRVVGAEGGAGAWYQKWHARWVCRDWELRHGGVAPREVRLVRISSPIPSPEEVARSGPYDPRALARASGRESVVFSAICADEPHGQLPPELRARHGLGPSTTPFKPWVKERAQKWRARREQAQARGQERSPWRGVIVAGAVLCFFVHWRRMDRRHLRG
jgi:hypothetical protein